MEDGQPALRAVRMGTLRVTMERDPGGVIRLASPDALPEPARSMPQRIAYWAERTPDAVMIADRGENGWRTASYADVARRIRPLAQALLDAGLSAERPLVILSGNRIEHALLGYAAMLAGIPHAPLSPAYSLVSKDFGKLRYILDLLNPGMVYAEDGAAFGPAIEAVVPADTAVVVSRNPLPGRPSQLLSDLETTAPTPALDAAAAAIGPDTIAKFLFTSGSTGSPKAVITTQRMLTTNQEMIRHALAFLADEPPILIDWMPWNHVAGGSHNLGIAVYNGGAFYIDDGQPTPQNIGRTIRNLSEVSPHVYFNVPKGYEMLIEPLRTNAALRESFFKNLKLLQYAGAGLSQYVWDGLDAAARDATGERIMMITGYGSTETAPFAFTTTWPVERAGMVGLPAPGLEIKLVPDGEKMELRLRGPNVTPGYWKDAEKTAQAFDAEGYYCIGDALKFADPDDVSKGFVFDGRVSEDFKLATGTWVNMAAVRGAALAAATPLARDLVLTGLDRNHIGALIFPDLEACRRLAGLPEGSAPAEIAGHPSVRAAFEDKLGALALKATGSSNHLARAILLALPPQMDKSEVTDKGSINQRAVMAARAAQVEDLYRDPPPPHVLVFPRKVN
ncbi:feruloyl-CoA synthase [Devosia enhydra]|uniref:Feruloyl-CoA synthase n=1 Tax=Devosia enhydra TaxID=665118 RepID=A0A1K2HSZ9_9HYPH|nr:feruloyl-CoA synthase [Devosia enhydra]SFZ81215.1 feruloyl-CoA synthase [Devosia enhydra]